MRVMAQPLFEVSLGECTLRQPRAAGAAGETLARPWSKTERVMVRHRGQLSTGVTS